MKTRVSSRIPDLRVHIHVLPLPLENAEIVPVSEVWLALNEGSHDIRTPGFLEAPVERMNGSGLHTSAIRASVLT
jgi:hypothetical protein